GFAASGPAHAQAGVPSEEPPGPDTVAITDLLVEPRWSRRAHGSRLLAASVDLWREDGCATVGALGIGAARVTRGFLTSAVWGPDGARRALDVDVQLVPQVRFHTGLKLSPT